MLQPPRSLVAEVGGGLAQLRGDEEAHSLTSQPGTGSCRCIRLPSRAGKGWRSRARRGFRRTRPEKHGNAGSRVGLRPRPRNLMPQAGLVLDLQRLRVSFPFEEGIVHAVHDAGFSIPRGRTLGLVGESGSGKTMTGLALLQLVPPPGR